MSTPIKFNLVLSNNVSNNTCNTISNHNYLGKINQTDTIELSTKQNPVSFKGARKVPAEIQKLITTKTFWKTLGLTISSTAFALWASITNNGENDTELSMEEIENKIQEKMLGLPPKEKTKEVKEIDNSNSEKITPQESTSVEAPKKRKGRKPKTLKLENEKQPDVNHTVRKIRRQQADDVQNIKNCAEAGYTLKETEEYTGIKVQQIKRLAKKENIDFSNTHKKTPITDEIRNEITRLNELNTPQAEIAQILNISPASVSRVLSGKHTLNQSESIKRLRRNFKTEFDNIAFLSRFSAEELCDKYLAKSCRVFSESKEDSFLNFATDKMKNPIPIHISDDNDFSKTIFSLKDEKIPENDAIYESYKNCFIKDSFISRIIDFKKNYIKETLDKISQTAEFEEIKKLDIAKDVTQEEMFDIICNCKISKKIIKDETAQSKVLKEKLINNEDEKSHTAPEQNTTEA